jgi:ArsR family transcriptional regulator
MNALPLLETPCCAPGAARITVGDARELAARFKALADPTRVAIVNRLAGAGTVCVCNFVDELDLSQPTVSHHLKILREAGLVESERRGTWAHYRLVPGAVEALRSALA